MANKVIDITNIGRLISDIKAKCVAWFWPKDDVQDIELATVATTGSYNDLLDKPTAATGAIIYVGTCPTAAATATKVVTTTAFPTQNGAPVVGIVIGVKFDLTNTATEPKLNVNGLGAVGIYYNAAVATSTSAVYGGTKNRYTFYMWNGTNWCWLSQGLDANDNTIGYQIRTSGQRLPVATACYRYRLLFTSADGTKLVPANSSTSTNATASRTPATAKIDPFGQILYYSYTTALSANGQPSASYQHQQYSGISIGYSFNNTGAAATMTYPAPIYIKCAPQTDGSAIIDSTTPYVQALPSTADGKIYIFLGIAISATTFELLLHHPVYYYKDGAIRLWTNASTPDVSSKADKVSGATNGNFAGLDTNGNLADSGKKASDFQESAEGQSQSPTIINPKEGDIYVQRSTSWSSISPSYTDSGSWQWGYTRTYDVTSAAASHRLRMSNIGSLTVTIYYTDADDQSIEVPYEDWEGYVFPIGIKSVYLSEEMGTPQSADFEQETTVAVFQEYIEGGWQTRKYFSGSYNDLTDKPTIPTVPTISTNIEQDKASDAKTASPKAVYDEAHPAVQTTQPQGGFLPNIEYNLGTLTGNVTFALASAVSGIGNKWYWCFKAGATAPTITWPTGLLWPQPDAEPPTIEANDEVEVEVKNGHIVALVFKPTS